MKGKFIFSFSLRLMDMATCKTSFNNWWLLDWFKTKIISNKKNYNNLLYVPHERKLHIINDLSTNLIAIIKKNDFSKFKNFMKRNHFACNLHK
jgi:hypothetical protein